MMKRFCISLLLVLVCMLLSVPAFAMVEQSESFYVADEANVLSGELEKRIIAMNGELESQCSGAQLVVVTTDYLDGMYADEYAHQLFYSWGVGDAAENNGMLLLLAPAENKGWIAVGAGITDDFTDDMANAYLDKYLWEDFDNGDYEAGTEKTVEALYDWFLDFYDAGVVNEPQPGAPAPAVGSGLLTGLGSLILLPFQLIGTFLPAIVIIAVIVKFASIGGGRRRRSYHYHPGHSHYGVGGFWHRPPHRHRPPPPRPPMGGFGGPRPGSSFSSRPGGFGGGGRSSFGGAGRSGRSSSSRPGSSRPRSSGGGGRSRGGGGRR